MAKRRVPYVDGTSDSSDRNGTGWDTNTLGDKSSKSPVTDATGGHERPRNCTVGGQPDTTGNRSEPHSHTGTTDRTTAQARRQQPVPTVPLVSLLPIRAGAQLRTPPTTLGPRELSETGGSSGYDGGSEGQSLVRKPKKRSPMKTEKKRRKRRRIDGRDPKKAENIPSDSSRRSSSDGFVLTTRKTLAHRILHY